MTKPASSPDRYTFQRDAYMQRMEQEGRLDDPHVQRMIKFYEDWGKRAQELESDPDWRQNNLEWDLRTTEWVLEKCRSDSYAQNLYAAMCNVRWQKRDVLPILSDQYWSCSWRSAGGIIADLQGKGDYIDWYCSGIRDTTIEDEESKFCKEKYVPEGVVTDEISNDLYLLGWVHSEWPEDEL